MKKCDCGKFFCREHEEQMNKIIRALKAYGRTIKLDPKAKEEGRKKLIDYINKNNQPWQIR